MRGFCKADTLLLEELFERTGCEYLSMLKEAHARQRVLAAIAGLDPGLYSLSQWSYALSYITSKDVVIETRQELAGLLESAAQMPD